MPAKGEKRMKGSLDKTGLSFLLLKIRVNKAGRVENETLIYLPEIVVAFDMLIQVFPF